MLIPWVFSIIRITLVPVLYKTRGIAIHLDLVSCFLSLSCSPPSFVSLIILIAILAIKHLSIVWTSESPIQPGRKAICNAHTKLIIDKDRYSIKVAVAKLDSCGSVSIVAHNLLNDIQPAHKYKLPKIRLSGIGGRTNLLDKVGILKVKQPDNKHCKLMCYVFDEEVGQTK